METAIGVFSSREHVEEAIQELLKSKIPKDEIVFLTKSDSDAAIVGKGLGEATGLTVAATAVSSGVILASILLVPGIGIVLGLGVGAATMLGVIGAEAASDKAKSASEGKPSQDAAFFREVLKEGHSLIIVRTESQQVMTAACSILDRLGLGTQGRSAVKMATAIRQVGDITIIDVVGRIAMGEGNVMLRENIREVLEKGNKKILLNLHDVGYVDSSGIGELVRTHTTVRSKGGQLSLFNLSKVVQDLLQITKLHAVFDIQADEASAIQSLGGQAASRAGV